MPPTQSTQDERPPEATRMWQKMENPESRFVWIEKIRIDRL
jgi:hypothetical protein